MLLSSLMIVHNLCRFSSGGNIAVVKSAPSPTDLLEDASRGFYFYDDRCGGVSRGAVSLIGRFISNNIHGVMYCVSRYDTGQNAGPSDPGRYQPYTQILSCHIALWEEHVH